MSASPRHIPRLRRSPRQLAVLVEPNGWLGAASTTAIRPFRHPFVHPALMRWIERARQASASPNSTATSVDVSRVASAGAAEVDH